MINDLPYLMVPLLVWFLSQVVKILIQLVKGNNDLRLIFNSGRMPSSHTATVVALLTTAWLIDGVSSPFFGIAALLAAVVIYDSLGVRQAAGDTGRVVNTIIDELDESTKERVLAKVYSPLKENVGHRTNEVVAGVVFGFFTTLVLLFDRTNSTIGDRLGNTFQPDGTRLLATISILTISSLLIAGWHKKTSQKYSYLFPAIWFFGIGIGFASFMQYQNIDVLSRLWFVAGVSIITALWLFSVLTYKFNNKKDHSNEPKDKTSLIHKNRKNLWLNKAGIKSKGK